MTHQPIVFTQPKSLLTPWGWGVFAVLALLVCIGIPVLNIWVSSSSEDCDIYATIRNIGPDGKDVIEAGQRGEPQPAMDAEKPRACSVRGCRDTRGCGRGHVFTVA